MGYPWERTTAVLNIQDKSITNQYEHLQEISWNTYKKWNLGIFLEILLLF